MNDVTFQYGDNAGITKVFYDDSIPSLSYDIKGTNRLKITELGINLDPTDADETELSSYQEHSEAMIWNGLDVEVSGKDINIVKIGNKVTIHFETIISAITLSNSIISSNASTPLPLRFRPSVNMEFSIIVTQDSVNMPGRCRIQTFYNYKKYCRLN